MKPEQRIRELIKAKPEGKAKVELSSECAQVALNAAESRNFRYMALRKLEEMDSPETVSTAKTLAMSSMTSDFIRLNAVGVLRRYAKAGNEEAQLALKEVAQDPSLKQFALAQ